jgi:hypothetical protein
VPLSASEFTAPTDTLSPDRKELVGTAVQFFEYVACEDVTNPENLATIKNHLDEMQRIFHKLTDAMIAKVGASCRASFVSQFVVVGGGCLAQGSGRLPKAAR